MTAVCALGIDPQGRKFYRRVLKLIYVPEKIGGHDVLLAEIPRGRTRKGYTPSAEVRARISASLTGRTQSAETIAKRVASIRNTLEQRKVR